MKTVIWILRYCLHVLGVSFAGTLPAAVFFMVIVLSSPDVTFLTLVQSTMLIAFGALLLIVFPFCFFIAVPAALLVSRHVRFTLPRMLVLGLLLVVPGVIFLDYSMYKSSGPDSGPPVGPYSFAHLAQSMGSPTDFMLMIGIPLLSSLMGAGMLWYMRFREVRTQ